MMVRGACLIAAGLACGPASGSAFAQSSRSFRLAEHAVNAGGHPFQGASQASSGFNVSIGAIGDAVSGPDVASQAFRLDGGFVPAYLPPGEVRNLVFDADLVTLAWEADPAAGKYALYRDLLSTVAGPGSGTCAQTAIASATTTDPDLPPAGDGYFYLVTARNRLHEEGTKGFRSDGVERPNPLPCP